MIFQQFQKVASVGLTSILLTLAFAQSVSAHAFNVLLLGSTSENYTDVYDAFRLATKERDGHANEESDGHLGGLDVYILTASDDTTVADIVVVIGPKAMEPALRLGVEARGGVFLGVQNTSAKMQADFLENVAFPDSAAEASYIAARMIDVAVRSQAGVEDRAALVQILSQY